MAQFSDKDYYALLGVSKDATAEEIRKAFQKKAVKLHPDVNKAPDAEEQFKEISEAYAVLSDEKKRARYDAMRSGNPFAASGSAQGYPGGYSTNPWGDPFGGFPFGGFGFNTQTRTRSRAYNPRAGADIDIAVELTDKQAKEGTKRAVTYQRYVKCRSCEGKGSHSAAAGITCPTCQGKGTLDIDLSSIFGFGVFETVCPECEGAGKVVEAPCDICSGSGRILSATEYVIDISAKSHDGDVLKVSGMGNAGTNAGASGDLNVHIGVASERLDERQRLGFSLLGFDIPFVVFGALAHVLPYMFVFVASFALVALALILFGGVKFAKRWWQNAGISLMRGMQNGLVMSLFMVSMYSCTARGF